jgi:hypothetical protein
MLMMATFRKIKLGLDEHKIGVRNFSVRPRVVATEFEQIGNGSTLPLRRFLKNGFEA